nr:MAG TPA: hypothetical protein [Caudoviricetes sp.]
MGIISDIRAINLKDIVLYSCVFFLCLYQANTTKI